MAAGERPWPGRGVGQPPSRPPPFQGGGVKVATVRLLPGGNDVGDLFPVFPRPDSLPPPPFFRGEVGWGASCAQVEGQ